MDPDGPSGRLRTERDGRHDIAVEDRQDFRSELAHQLLPRPAVLAVAVFDEVALPAPSFGDRTEHQVEREDATLGRRGDRLVAILIRI